LENVAKILGKMHAWILDVGMHNLLYMCDEEEEEDDDDDVYIINLGECAVP
jgi:hypothetical protein